MTGLEVAVHEITQDWRIRLAAAEDLLALVTVELAEMQDAVNRM
ncbi:hypothetical protein [Nonomuraea turcica]|nr:hypothetical protein [Nonomuraea sp. G32]MDP4501126.1 hypothetical protein [Nonomuraea sp. G32]